MKRNQILHYSIIGIFVTLYILIATISMINSVAFFDLSHSGFMSWSLAIGFELGAAASLAGIIILEKTNRNMIWSLFVILTLFQMMANSYHAYVNLNDYKEWIELFGLLEEEPIMQKRILSIISGAILPLVALGFIKSLVDYIRPDKETETVLDEEQQPVEEPLKESNEEILEETETVLDEEQQPIEEPLKESNEEILEETETVLDEEQKSDEIEEHIDNAKLKDTSKEKLNKTNEKVNLSRNAHSTTGNYIKYRVK